MILSLFFVGLLPLLMYTGPYGDYVANFTGFLIVVQNIILGLTALAHCQTDRHAPRPWQFVLNVVMLTFQIVVLALFGWLASAVWLTLCLLLLSAAYNEKRKRESLIDFEATMKAYRESKGGTAQVAG